MDLTPTIMEAPSAGAAESSTAEQTTTPSQEVTTSTPSGETQNTQAVAVDPNTHESTAGADAATKIEGDKEAQAAPENAEPTDRLDKHPRFKQVVTERKQFKEALETARLEKAQLEGRLQALEAAGKANPQPQGKDYDAELSAIDAKLEAGDITLAQARAMERKLNQESMQSQMAALQSQVSEKLTAGQRAAAEQAQVASLTESFMKANPDFIEVRDSGELDAIRQQNPLHDHVSAYYALKAQKAEAAHKADLEAAVKAAEEKVRKDFAAKRSARTLSGSTSAPPAAPGGIDPELANPEKYGGITAVLASRLARRRAASS